ncbi:TPA: hypothetical protein HA241_04785 [Candidatus Woesearchaeota archaeon]|nr:hypothetical protein [Candidatus Woesearchaeota archaeon]
MRHIQEIHPAVVDKWSDARTDLSAQLRESSRNKEIWERDWRKNYAGVQRSNQLKQDALNHPWMNNTHPTFNTSAYSAKLVGLSAQLESLQSGNPHSPNRLMRG